MLQRSCAYFLVCILILSAIGYIIHPAISQGNAEVSRKRNLNMYELQRMMNVDFYRTRNFQLLELQRTMNIDVYRLRNFEPSEMQRNMNADVLRLRNLQLLEMTTLIYEYAINITELLTKDENGNPANNFLRGEIVQLEFTVTNIGNIWLENGVISIIIIDPLNRPVTLSYSSETLKSGQTQKHMFGWRIPFNSLKGNYTAKVMIFTDWPSKGGVGLTFKQVQFNAQ